MGKSNSENLRTFRNPYSTIDYGIRERLKPSSHRYQLCILIHNSASAQSQSYTHSDTDFSSWGLESTLFSRAHPPAKDLRFNSVQPGLSKV